MGLKFYLSLTLYLSFILSLSLFISTPLALLNDLPYLLSLIDEETLTFKNDMLSYNPDL
jgi:hypothetical protein